MNSYAMYQNNISNMLGLSEENKNKISETLGEINWENVFKRATSQLKSYGNEYGNNEISSNANSLSGSVLSDEFQSHVEKYDINVTDDNIEELQSRYNDSVDKVNQLNQMSSDGGHNVTFSADTYFSTFTDEEKSALRDYHMPDDLKAKLQQAMYGNITEAFTNNNSESVSSNSNTSYVCDDDYCISDNYEWPTDIIDWSTTNNPLNKKCTTDVKFQDLQGYCWAYAFCAHLETQQFINSDGKGQLQELSVEQLVHCSYNHAGEAANYLFTLTLVLCNKKDTNESCANIITSSLIDCADFSAYYNILDEYFGYDSIVKSPTIGVFNKEDYNTDDLTYMNCSSYSTNSGTIGVIAPVSLQVLGADDNTCRKYYPISLDIDDSYNKTCKMYNTNTNNPYCVSNTVVADNVMLTAYNPDITDTFDTHISTMINKLKEGSLLITGWVGFDAFYSYSSGIITDEFIQQVYEANSLTRSNVQNYTDHSVVIEGYYPPGAYSPNSPAAWKIRNSWDTTWGEDGYFYIEVGKNVLGIESGFCIAQLTNVHYRDYNTSSNLCDETRPWGCGGIKKLCSNIWESVGSSDKNTYNEDAFKDGCSLLITECSTNDSDFCNSTSAPCNTGSLSFDYGCAQGRETACSDNLCENIGYDSFKKQEQEFIDYIDGSS